MDGVSQQQSLVTLLCAFRETLIGSCNPFVSYLQSMMVKIHEYVK